MIKNKRANTCQISSTAEIGQKQNLPKTHGGKFFRKIAICALAGFMGALGFLGAGCTPSSANIGSNPPTSPPTEGVGLITPHADDPVILTTESGLEIKYGNATINPSLGSSNLNLVGYPYFITNDGTKDYTWVIIGIGLAPDDSPAGSAILNETKQNLRLLYDWGQSIKTNAEIPLGSVLVIANTTLGTANYNSCTTYASSPLHTTLEGFYTNNNLGLSTVKSNILPIDLVTRDYAGGGGSNAVFAYNTSTAHIFLLAGTEEQNFYILDYIQPTSTASGQFWLRGCKAQNSTYGRLDMYDYYSGSIRWDSYHSSYNLYGCFVMTL